MPVIIIIEKELAWAHVRDYETRNNITIKLLLLKCCGNGQRTDKIERDINNCFGTHGGFIRRCINFIKPTVLFFGIQFIMEFQLTALYTMINSFRLRIYYSRCCLLHLSQNLKGLHRKLRYYDNAEVNFRPYKGQCLWLWTYKTYYARLYW